MNKQKEGAATTVEDLNVDQGKAEGVKGGPMAVDYLLNIQGVDGESRSRTSTPSVSEIVPTKLATS